MNNRDLAFKAQRFQEKLESLLKRFPPSEYAPLVVNLMDTITEDIKQWAAWPPHFLIHSIEANCAYHRQYRREPVTKKALVKIMNAYKDYFDPVAEFNLRQDEGIIPFFINLARQQFYLQQRFGGDDISRGIILFAEGCFSKSQALFQKEYGLNFSEWLLIAFGVHAAATNRNPAWISSKYYTESTPKVARDQAIHAFFSITSTTPQEGRHHFARIREQIGWNIAAQFETYFKSILTDRPLLRLGNDQYLVVHKQLLLQKAVEGIYDLCKSKWPGEFGNEFGKSFENYIGKLLYDFMGGPVVFNERDLRVYTHEKVCDYLVNDEDYILLLECKGTEYSALIGTENAMKKDNSTKKISTGIEQLVSAARLIRSGLFKNLLGDCDHKKIIAGVVTFKQLYYSNTSWYWSTVISNTLDSNSLEGVDSIFEYKPQIFSAMEMERLLLFCKQHQKNLLQVFRERLFEQQELSGDWYAYLKLKWDERIPFHNLAFDTFFDKNLPKNKKY